MYSGQACLHPWFLVLECRHISLDFPLLPVVHQEMPPLECSGMPLQLALGLALLKRVLEPPRSRKARRLPARGTSLLERTLSRPTQLAQCFVPSQGTGTLFGKTQRNDQQGSSHTRNPCVFHHHSVLRKSSRRPFEVRTFRERDRSPHEPGQSRKPVPSRAGSSSFHFALTVKVKCLGFHIHGEVSYTSSWWSGIFVT